MSLLTGLYVSASWLVGLARVASSLYSCSVIGSLRFPSSTKSSVSLLSCAHVQHKRRRDIRCARTDATDDIPSRLTSNVTRSTHALVLACDWPIPPFAGSLLACDWPIPPFAGSLLACDRATGSRNKDRDTCI